MAARLPNRLKRKREVKDDSKVYSLSKEAANNRDEEDYIGSACLGRMIRSFGYAEFEMSSRFSREDIE